MNGHIAAEVERTHEKPQTPSSPAGAGEGVLFAIGAEILAIAAGYQLGGRTVKPLTIAPAEGTLINNYGMLRKANKATSSKAHFSIPSHNVI